MTNINSKQIKIHMDVAEKLDKLRIHSWGKLSYNDIINELIDISVKSDKITELLRECCRLIR
jgi:predicted CopG family antitoxin